MSYLAPIPEELQQVEYVKLYFHLQLKDTFDLPQAALLQLRRELLQALKTLEGWGGEDIALLKNLLQPPVSQDPQVRRIAQKPAPAFVLQPNLDICGHIEAQQRIVLPVLFVGQAVQAVNAFVSLWEMLGQQGLYYGSGRFQLEGVESEDASGVRAMLWSEGCKVSITPPVSELHWWLERQPAVEEWLALEIVSPMRLLKKGKPLFRADFKELFPFLLRRVSALLTSHADVEIIKEPRFWQAIADAAREAENSLQWHDWRTLHGPEKSQDLGGLMGRICLTAEGLEEILWILRLGSLFNVGKGAAYGFGQYRLRTYC
ncbi:CRISPR system precrRNA processing endoribonuclease RAMP protein Cas6 [Malonomonas rubra]|uniref:CRISPR system precrRNA processing endoribonuclease RAMP protein Cas6 n=1 Tax=Malonomonas rubra TaxID=57040 RepID=UPI0026F2134B|nr:CRISPR system precrRNA processing endoribonuclease RAMP protein Cas6 [Malonomonas rubra]